MHRRSDVSLDHIADLGALADAFWCAARGHRDRADVQCFASHLDAELRVANRHGNLPENRNDNLGFRLARAQTRDGGPAPDPTCTASGRMGTGEIEAGAGVEVAVADARSNPRRWPTYVWCAQGGRP